METVSDRRPFALRRVTVQQYTARGQVGTITRYTDLAGTTKVGDSLYTYDDGGRLTQLLHRDAATGTLALYTYAFDVADRMTSKTENGTYTSYQYDNSDQLTRDGASTFSYDDTGNRTNPGYATTTGNRMTTDGVWTYTYDDVGNVTSRSKGTGTITWDYTYDHNNQMLTASYKADGSTISERVTYAYDAYRNLVRRDGKIGMTGSVRVAIYAYDGWDTAKPNAVGTENFDVWFETSNYPEYQLRLNGPGIDEVLARAADDGTTTWYATDHQGSVRVVLNDSGASTGTLNYTAFGERTATGTGATSDLGYASKYWDFTLGLQYNLARWYDPVSGKWLSADPMSFDAGDANLYRYVGNRPTTARDPSGMDEYPFAYQGRINHTPAYVPKGSSNKKDLASEIAELEKDIGRLNPSERNPAWVRLKSQLDELRKKYDALNMPSPQMVYETAPPPRIVAPHSEQAIKRVAQAQIRVLNAVKSLGKLLESESIKPNKDGRLEIDDSDFWALKKSGRSGRSKRTTVVEELLDDGTYRYFEIRTHVHYPNSPPPTFLRAPAPAGSFHPFMPIPDNSPGVDSPDYCEALYYYVAGVHVVKDRKEVTEFARMLNSKHEDAVFTRAGVNTFGPLVNLGKQIGIDLIPGLNTYDKVKHGTSLDVVIAVGEDALTIITLGGYTLAKLGYKVPITVARTATAVATLQIAAGTARIGQGIYEELEGKETGRYHITEGFIRLFFGARAAKEFKKIHAELKLAKKELVEAQNAVTDAAAVAQAAPAPAKPVLNPATVEALKATGLDDAALARYLDVLGDAHVFRGTTEGFAGNPALQRLGLSPTSVDPLVATVFAAEGAAKGAKPMVLFGRRTAFGETLEMGNVRKVLEREVAVPLAPTEFAKTAPHAIPLERARAILKEMGFDVPPSFASGADATTFLHNSKRMTPEQIKQFIDRATGGR